jgi:hypothetical protein
MAPKSPPSETRRVNVLKLRRFDAPLHRFRNERVTMRFVSAPLAAVAVFGLPVVAQAKVHIHIDLRTQSMHVASRSGDFDWAVSTGRRGHRTPTGVYHPQRMYKIAYSAKYQNAPMPHSIFFRGGYAIHGTGAVGHLGRTASHGCVRLAPENAAALYEMVKAEGATIVISGAAPGQDHVAEAHHHHRAGHRLAAKWRQRYLEDPAFAYAPQERRHGRTLRDWVNNPMGNW